jgi:S-DNA-T family DNA segregation ATPase FtsK/SpoIIIE
MYQQALEVVYESGSASASMLQRRLRVGYNRAANLIEELEKNGIVGPAQGSKPRQVLPRSE